MRLPHQFIASPWFLFSDSRELIAALGSSVSLEEAKEISLLSDRDLPPLTSLNALAVMIGINPGLAWSFVYRANKHYRMFSIPKGSGVRLIQAPKIGLKIIQKWLSIHLAKAYLAPPHVYGFVPGKSHVQAAYQHRGAEWAFSIDIKDFFSSTPQQNVFDIFVGLGYSAKSANLCAALVCYRGFLSQGSPTSPCISNFCFLSVDEKLVKLAHSYNCKLSRYADDITFSGEGKFPVSLKDDLLESFVETPWKLASEKECLQPNKGRIKIHGLLVGGGDVRLTKGYRNKLRAYSHILNTKGDNASNHSKLKGHISYRDHIDQIIFDMESKDATDVED